MTETNFRHKFVMHKPSKDTHIVFTCRSGKRSVVASKAAEEQGFRFVYNYTGGANEWFAEGSS